MYIDKIAIDKKNGDIIISDIRVNKSTTVNVLPKQFTIGDEIEYRLGNKKIKVLRATAEHATAKLKFTVNLRFEFGVLLKASILLEDKRKKYDGMEYYERVDERIVLYRDWLRGQGIIVSSVTDAIYFNWGEIQIIRNKSEDIYIGITFTK